MAFSSGTFSLYSPGNPVVTGTTISSTWANNTLSDIATGLSTCVLKDGSQTITANIPMSGFKFTGLGAGSATGNSLRYEQLFTTGNVTALGTFTFPTTIGVGAATPAASGAGVTFPATQSASTDANTLDDYEEGTWTPAVGGTATYTTQAATYTKIGNVVRLSMLLQINSIGTGSAQTISGLPFTVKADSSQDTDAMPVSYWGSLNSTQVYVSLIPDNGATTMTLASTGAAATSLTTPVSLMQNSTVLRAGGVYHTT